MTRLEETDVWKLIQAQLPTTSIFKLAAAYEVTVGEIAGAVRRTEIGGEVRLGISAPKKPKKPKHTRTQRQEFTKIDPFRELVGNWPDEAVATKVRVAPSAVSEYRDRHGIPAYSAKKAYTTTVSAAEQGSPARPWTARNMGKPWSKVDAFKAELGVLRDSVIARKAGLTQQAVRNYRTRRGIPSVTEARRQSEAAATDVPESTAAAMAPTGSAPAEIARATTAKVEIADQTTTTKTNYVWSVRFDEDQSCFVRGADVASAVAVLAKAGIADVRSLCRVGELLA